MKVKSIFIILILLLGTSAAMSQETVFSLLKSEMKLADTYFANKDYRSALILYRNMARKNPSKDLELKIAHSHLFLKQYKEAVAVYEKSWSSADLPTRDLYNYAEAQS